jgi:hypothetical protein
VLRVERVPYALIPVVHEDLEQRIQDARIRIVLPEKRPLGLLRLDIAMVDRRGLGGYSATPAIVTLCVRSSAADAAIRKALQKTLECVKKPELRQRAEQRLTGLGQSRTE